MSVIRINKRDNYSIIANHIFKEKGMSLKSKGLLAMMLSLPDDWSYNVAGLVKLSKDGKDSVMSALKELEQNGYLIRTRMMDERGRFAGYQYDIFEEPQSLSEEPLTENPNTVKPNTEQPNTEDPQLSITNKINNLDNKKTNDIRKKEGKKEQKENYNSILSNNIRNNELKDLYIEFIKARQLAKKPLTNRALKMLITRVERLSNMDVSIQKKMLENAIMNGWNNVYLPDEKREEEQTLKSLKNFYGA